MYRLFIFTFILAVGASPIPQLGDSFGFTPSAQGTSNSSYNVLPYYATSQNLTDGNYIPNFSQDQCQQECDRRADKCKFFVVPLNSSGFGDCRMFDTLDKSKLVGSQPYKVKVKADPVQHNFISLPLSSTNGDQISGSFGSGNVECQKACLSTSGCILYSVNTKDQSCVLKSGDFNYLKVSADANWNTFVLNAKPRNYDLLPLHYSGSDITYYEGPAKNCPSLCDSTKGCVAFGINDPLGINGVGCWLKSALTSSQSDGGITYRAHSSTDYQQFSGMSMQGTIFISRLDSNVTSDSCQTTCNSMNACVGFTIDTSKVTRGCDFYTEINGEATETQNRDLWLKKEYKKLQVLDGGQWKCVDQKKSSDPNYANNTNFPYVSTIVDCASADNSSSWNKFLFNGHGLFSGEGRYLSGWTWRIFDNSYSSYTTDSKQLDTTGKVDVANRLIFNNFDTFNGSQVVNLKSGPSGQSGCLQINTGNVVFENWSGDQINAQCAQFKLAAIA